MLPYRVQMGKAEGGAWSVGYQSGLRGGRSGMVQMESKKCAVQFRLA
jgi:hypothetical protein